MEESYERFVTRFQAPQLSAKQAWETIDLMEAVMRPVPNLPPMEHKSGNMKGGLLDLQGVLAAAQDEDADAEGISEPDQGKALGKEEEEESPEQDDGLMENAVLELLDSTMGGLEPENQTSTDAVLADQPTPPSIQADVLYPYPGEVDEADRFYSTEIPLGTKCPVTAEEQESGLTEEAIRVITSKREYYQKERADSGLRL